MTAARFLYLHVPFCASICYYCDFKRQMYRSDTADQWLDALEEELKHTKINTSLDTIYIGGGTPSCLSENQLDKLLTLLDPYKNEILEYTVELNPETVSEDKLNILCRHGVNRVSIGLQSGDEALLKKLNRHHTFDDVERLVHQIQACGISNISLDLMYSLPDQTMEILKQSTDQALSLHPSHLSLYSLTIEENSVFGKQGIEHLDEDTEADMYEWLCAYLQQHGYHHYEISNFALDGRASIHNTRVWEYEDFYGIGYGAWGKDETGRYEHATTLNQYLKDPLKKIYTPLTINEQMFETVMMGLRLRAGIDCRIFQKRFGKDLTAVYPASIQELIKQGLLECSEDHLFCTNKGFELLNSVLVRIMEETGL